MLLLVTTNPCEQSPLGKNVCNVRDEERERRVREGRGEKESARGEDEVISESVILFYIMFEHREDKLSYSDA